MISYLFSIIKGFFILKKLSLYVSNKTNNINFRCKYFYFIFQETSKPSERKNINRHSVSLLQNVSLYNQV